jgi:hypothetical protein
MAGGAVYLHEVAQPEILDPCGVEGEDFCILCSWYVPGNHPSPAASMVDRV